MRIAYAVVVFAMLSLAARARAHVPLATGDVALVGVWTDGTPMPRTFAFVALRELHTDQTLTFTDDGWLATGGFRLGEGVLGHPILGTIPAGTVITMPASGALDVEPGDQIFAYTGSVLGDGTLSGTLLFGLELGGPWQADATSTTTSALPPAIASAEIALGALHNYAYAGTTRGTRAELLAAIRDPSNWVGSDTSQPAFVGSFTVLGAPGESCVADADCAVGFCAERVCCDTTCHRGEVNHCFACSFGLFDPRNGTCQAAPPTFLCGLAGGPCGTATRCDGVSTTCPPQVLVAAGTVCRAPRDACDTAETCTGASPSCPADVPIACDGGEPDAGELDAGALDAGELDAGEPDGGASETDAGALDAGVLPIDADVLDAGPPTNDADVVTLDAGPARRDASVMLDSSVGRDAGPLVPGGGGCSCSTAPDGSGAVRGWLVVAALSALAGYVTYRRRSRSRRP